MIHLPNLIQDLALILIAAAFVTVLCRRLNQPAVLGYVIAGFLVGPHFPWFPSVADIEGVKLWAELGVIFLLFALGLEFSFRKLIRVGGPASITAVVEVVVMTCVGFITGRLLGWNSMDSLFLGGILAISSTTIIIRAFDELGMKTRGFVGLVFGVLIVEDLVAILLLVLLSTVAISRTFSGADMAENALKLGFFLTLWFVSGIFIVPTILSRWRKWMREETLLVVSIGLCFFMVVLATKAGFSPALGAFIMGSILAETTEGSRIEHLIQPVKDLFGAVFFVSVGMLLDPVLLSAYAIPIAILTVVTIVGKTTSTMFGALLSGQSLKTSLQSGMSLAQIGEFSFIIASLGLTLKVTSEFLYPVAIGVSVLTTFTTPYMIKSADGLYNVLERKLPPNWLSAIERFSASTKGVATTDEWKLLLRSYLIRIVPNAIVAIAISIVVRKFALPTIAEHTTDPRLANTIALLISFIASAPFLWALAISPIAPEKATQLWREDRYRAALVAVEAMRWAICVVLTCILAARFFSALVSILTVSTLAIGLGLIFSRHLGKTYAWFENRFVANLTEKERAALEVEIPNLPPLAPWDAHLVRLQLSADSALSGRTLAEATIREKFGVTIALIERGSRVLAAPNRDVCLYPSDFIHVIGTDEQIGNFRSVVESQDIQSEGLERLNYALLPYFIDDNSKYTARSIRDSGIRESSQGLVVGLERDGRRYLNPDSNLPLQPGDLLWIVGDSERMKNL